MSPPDNNNSAANAANESDLRSGVYALLGELLRQAPDNSLLQRLQSIPRNPSAEGIEAAWSALGDAAEAANPETLESEYTQLFIGIGKGEITPYASWYLTGFLMEKPLGELRTDLSRLGIERAENVHEPEDHIAALSEVMAMLISDAGNGPDEESTFFNKHIRPWATRFFADLEKASSADFYRPVGRLGREFLDLEQRYLDMTV